MSETGDKLDVVRIRNKVPKIIKITDLKKLQDGDVIIQYWEWDSKRDLSDIHHFDLVVDAEYGLTVLLYYLPTSQEQVIVESVGDWSNCRIRGAALEKPNVFTDLYPDHIGYRDASKKLNFAGEMVKKAIYGRGKEND